MSKPAFPSFDLRGGEVVPSAAGLTKREYAAIHIAAALEMRIAVYGAVDPSMVAARAVALADAVLREAGE